MLSIFKFGNLSLLRDKGGVFFVMLFPTLLVFILGNMLAFMDNPDEKIEPIAIAYALELSDPAEVAVVEGFLASIEEGGGIAFTRVDDTAGSLDALERGELSALVLFKDPFVIEITDGVDRIQNRAVHAIFESVSRIAASYVAVADIDPQLLGRIASQDATTSLVALKDAQHARSMLDYYAVTMIVMILFMGSGIGGASILYEDRKNGTLRRIQASPASKLSIYLQYVGSTLLQNVLQVGVVMLTSTLLLGAHLATTPLDNLLLFGTMFFAGMAISCLMMLVSLYIKGSPTYAVMGVMWVLLFMSGTFSKDINIPGFTEHSPIYLIQQAAFDLTVFGRAEKCLVVLALSVTVVVLSSALGTLLFRRKKALS
jgi:ABC-2 type transport system permease protein